MSTGALVRAVLDANVLVRFFLTPQGGNAKLLGAILADAFTLVTSDFILAEVADVLGRPHLQKFGPYPPAFITEAIDGLRAKAHVVAGTFEVFVVTKDPKDNPVLACAIEGHADFLVTDDRRHLIPLKEYQGVRIVNPPFFLREVLRVR